MRNSLQVSRNVARMALVGLVSSIGLWGSGAGAADPMGSTSFIAGETPRMLIIMDTSRSMRFDPLYQSEYPLDDYNGQPDSPEVGPVCGETGSPAPVITGGTQSTVTGAVQGTDLTLDCGVNGGPFLITSIQWAAYGQKNASTSTFPSSACGMPDLSSMLDRTSGCDTSTGRQQFRSGDGFKDRGWVDVTQQFNLACVGKQSCTVHVDNTELGGNPCPALGALPERAKYALVKFSCSTDPCPSGRGSKFCIAKKALHTTVNENSGAINLAAAGYYQLLWSAHRLANNATFATNCWYDIYARNLSVNFNNVITTTFDDGGPLGAGTCNPEGISATLGGVCTSQPAHQCTKTSIRIPGAIRYQNDNAPSVRPGTAAPWVSPPPSDRATPLPAQYYSNALSHWDTDEFLYIRLTSLSPAAVCSAAPASFTGLTEAGNPWGDANTLHGPIGGPLNPGLPGAAGVGCLAGNPCAYFNRYGVEQVWDGSVTVFQPHGAAPVTIFGTPYNQGPTIQPSASQQIYTSDPSLSPTSCPLAVAGYSDPGGFPGCTAVNPCDLTRVGGATPANNYLCPTGWTMNGTNCTRTRNGYNPSLTISQGYTVASHPPTPGTATYTRVGLPTSSPFSYTLNLADVLAGKVSCLVGSTSVAGGNYPPLVPGVKTQASGLGCAANDTVFPGTCQLTGTSTATVVGSTTVYGSVNTDLGEVTCTADRYRSSYLAQIAAVNDSYCQYTRQEYTYWNLADFCRYQRFDFGFEQDNFTYRWVNNDGDYLGSFARTPSYATNATTGYCSTAPVIPTTYDPVNGFSTPGLAGFPSSNSRCAPELAQGVDGCPGGSLICKLRRNSAAGRFVNFKGASYLNPDMGGAQPDNFWGGGASFCQLPDFSPGTPAASVYVANWADWCTTNGTPFTPDSYDSPKLIADYYQPTRAESDFTTGPAYWGTSALNPMLPPTPLRGDRFMTQEDGGGSGLRAFKDRGFSASDITPLTATLDVAQPAVSFVSGFLDPAADVASMFTTYSSANTSGLRMPDYGDITPLTGSLDNALSYIQAVQATDGGTCPKYSVLLVTDGDESPANLPGIDPVAAVTALRNAGVNVYVVGFGVSSPGLDLMARTAGTDVDGGAYNASDQNTLRAALNDIVNLQQTGFFSRSKPLLTSDGKRMYIAYFSSTPDGGAPQEFKGYLDAYSITGSTVAKDWAFNQKLASQTSYDTPTSTSTPRKVYTVDDTALVDFHLSLACSGADYNIVTAMYANCATDLAQAVETVRFVRNDDSTPATFLSGKVKTSRVSDIFHSQPALDGPAFFTSAYTQPTAYQDLGSAILGFEAPGDFDYVKATAAYQAYAAANASKEQTVFVQSNSGAVHAIRDEPPAATLDAWAGEERWAFVPRQVLRKYPNGLPGSREDHRWLADGSFGLSDVCFGQTNCEKADGSGWLSVLVGALGRGGPYLFALDVTKPAAPVWIWDFNSDPNALTDSDLLEAWAPPVIARVRVDNAPDKYTWGAFFGSGYRSRRWSANPNAHFYVLDVKPPTAPMRETKPFLDSTSHESKFAVPPENYISRPWPRAPRRPANNIPARARVVRPGDGSRASRVYFGDTDGKLWRMDVTSDQVDSWKPTVMFNPFRMNYTNGTGCLQPTIRSLPDQTVPGTIGFGPDPATGPTTPATATSLARPPKLPPLFTRPYLGLDPTSRRTMLYAGSGDATAPNTSGAGAEQNYFWAVEDVEGTSSTCNWGKLRWAYYLNQSTGDKVLTEPVVIGPNIIVAVYRAKPSVTGPVCGDPGRTFLYCFDKLTGDPQACLIDSSGSPIDTGSPIPGRSRYIELGSPGIAADMVVTGSTIHTFTDTNPNNPLAIDTDSGAGSLRIKSWRRVR